MAEPWLDKPNLDWMQTAEGSPADPGVWLRALGNIAGLAGTGIDKLTYEGPQRLLGSFSRPGVVGGAARAALPSLASQSAFLQEVVMSMGANDVQQVYKEHGAQAAWRYNVDKHLPGGSLTQFVMETAVDPTTYLGFGLPGKLAKALPAAGKAAGAARAGLEALNVADTAIAKAAAAPITATGRALRKLPPFQPSSLAKLSEFQDKLHDALGEAKSLGYKYKSIKMGQPLLGAWPGTSKKATLAETAAWKSVENKIHQLTDPMAKFRAAVMKEYANINAGNWGIEAAGENEELVRAGAAQADINAVWQTRHRKVIQLIKAVEETIDKATTTAGPPITSPAQEMLINQLTEGMIRDVRDVTSKARTILDAARGKMSREQYMQVADQTFRDRNARIQQIIKGAEEGIEYQFYPHAFKTTRVGTTGAKVEKIQGIPTFPEHEGLRDLQGRLSELQAMETGLPGYFGKMSPERASTLESLMPSIDRYAKFVDKDRNSLNNLLAAIQSRHPAAMLSNAKDSEDLLRKIQPFAQPFELTRIKNTLLRWTSEGADLIADDPLDLVLHRISMDKRTSLDIKGPPSWARPLQTMVQAWKEQALASPRFHLQNISSILAMGSLAGVNPGLIARNLAEGMGYLLRTREVRPPSMVSTALADWEQELPRTVAHGGFIMEILGDQGQLLARGESPIAMARIPTALRAGIGALAGLGAGPLGAVGGAALGITAPSWVKASKLLGSTIEHAARTTAWLVGKEKYIKGQWGQFVKGVDNDLRGVRPVVPPAAWPGGRQPGPQLPGPQLPALPAPGLAAPGLPSPAIPLPGPAVPLRPPLRTQPNPNISILRAPQPINWRYEPQVPGGPIMTTVDTIPDNEFLNHLKSAPRIGNLRNSPSIVAWIYDFDGVRDTDAMLRAVAGNPHVEELSNTLWGLVNNVLGQKFTDRIGPYIANYIPSIYRGLSLDPGYLGLYVSTRTTPGQIFLNPRVIAHVVEEEVNGGRVLPQDAPREMAKHLGAVTIIHELSHISGLAHDDAYSTTFSHAVAALFDDMATSINRVEDIIRKRGLYDYFRDIKDTAAPHLYPGGTPPSVGRGATGLGAFLGQAGRALRGGRYPSAAVGPADSGIPSQPGITAGQPSGIPGQSGITTGQVNEQLTELGSRIEDQLFRLGVIDPIDWDKAMFIARDGSLLGGKITHDHWRAMKAVLDKDTADEIQGITPGNSWWVIPGKASQISGLIRFKGVSGAPIIEIYGSVTGEQLRSLREIKRHSNAVDPIWSIFSPEKIYQPTDTGFGWDGLEEALHKSGYYPESGVTLSQPPGPPPAGGTSAGSLATGGGGSLIPPTPPTTQGGQYIPPGGRQVPPGGPGTYEARYTSQQIKSVLDGIRSMNGRAGPQKLSQLLATNGIDINDTSRIVQRWMSISQQGDVAGEALATRANFDYTKTDNLEEFLKYTIPFLIWPKRAIPFYLQAIAEHPGLLMAIDRYNNISEEETAGLSPRFQGMVRTGRLGEEIARRVFGVKGKLLAGPLEMIMPFAEISGPRASDAPGEAVKRVAGDIGFGLAPWITTPLTLLGAFGDQPYPNLLRHSGLMESILGANPEAPWQEAAGRAQQLITGKEASTPSDWLGYLVRQRLMEKSVEETGQPQAATYTRAATDPANPLYKAALADVQRERGGQSWAGFLSPMFTRPLRGTEEAATTARAQLPIFPRNEQGDLSPFPPGALQAAWAAFQAGDDTQWRAYQDQMRAFQQQATSQHAAAVEANPASRTYTTPSPPVSAPAIYSRVRAFVGMKTSKERERWYGIVDKDRLGRSYLAWIASQGHNPDRGDIGTLQDVQRFLSTRGQ